MAEKTDLQLIEELISKREKFSKGQTLGMEPKPKPDKEADQGMPSTGWRQHLQNIYESVTNAPIKKKKVE